jgi:hypothetical protein
MYVRMRPSVCGSVRYLGLMFLVTAMHAWGMFLSCVAPTLPVAIFLAPMSILPYILFSGTSSPL